MLHERNYRSEPVCQIEPLPRTSEPATESIVRFVLCRCFGRVHRLEIERHDGRLVLYGRTSTYHAKQLVQHAAQEAVNDLEVENRIEVGAKQ